MLMLRIPPIGRNRNVQAELGIFAASAALFARLASQTRRGKCLLELLHDVHDGAALSDSCLPPYRNGSI